MQTSQRLPFNSKALGKSLLMSKKNMMAHHKRSEHNNSVQYESHPLATSYGKDFNESSEKSPLKPRLMESKVAQDKRFYNLSNGFQKIFAKEKEKSEIKIPIAGYGGHRVGYHSNNIFGKPFRKCSIESKRIQRFLGSRPKF